MISLFYDDRNKVYLKYYADLLEEMENQKHLKVEEVKDPEEQAGKVVILMADSEKYW